MTPPEYSTLFSSPFFITLFPFFQFPMYIFLFLYFSSDHVKSFVRYFAMVNRSRTILLLLVAVTKLLNRKSVFSIEFVTDRYCTVELFRKGKRQIID